MNTSPGKQLLGPLWNWPFLAVLTMALSIAAYVTGFPALAIATIAAYAALLWRLQPSTPMLFVIVLPALPILVLPLVDPRADYGALISMAMLLVWTGIVCGVWRRTEDLNDRLALVACVGVVVATGAFVYVMKPGSTLFAPNPVATLQTAAESGDADAQFALAVRYRNGDGVDQDYTKAMDLAKRSADQGNAQAQTLVGMMYQGGEGVAPDASEAASYYQKAAEQNDPWAQSLLGGMYLSGEGVEQNNVLAYKWLTRAAAQGNAAARSLLDAAKDTFTDDEKQQGEQQAAQN
jgi:hypothetical protein